MSEDLHPVVKVEYDNGHTLWMPYEEYLAMQQFNRRMEGLRRKMWREIMTTAYYDQTWKHNLTKPGTFYRL